MLKKFLFFCATVLLTGSHLWALNLSELRTEIRRSMRDTSSVTDDRRYSDALLNDFINEAQRELVSATRVLEMTTSYVLSPRTTYYSLPENLMHVKQVDFRNGAGQVINLEELAWRSLYQNNANWERMQGSPVQYVISQATSSTASSSSTLRISYMPIPTNTSTGTVTIWFYPRADNLNSDSQLPFNGMAHLFPYHYTIVYNVVMRLKLIEGRLEEAQAFSVFYANSLELMRSKANELPNYNPGMGAASRSR